ncbi:SAM-dependent methyltransferase [Terrabacter aeriphilus]|uniref:SAM-dependent methyltransferase n=1 Tax=Terrabacter aeriphilus TaxID=515662 RepID=UPI0031E81F05
MDPVPWRDAWHTALYAAGRGFYVAGGGPAAHFTTATHRPTGALLAEALLAVPEHPVRVVVDVGAGRGELATHLVGALASGSRYAAAPGHAGPPPPDGVRVVAVDVVARPPGLDERVEWLRSPGGGALPEQLDDLEDALVVAHEWLDVVPCTVAQVDPHGELREVLVDPVTGAETFGDLLEQPDREWCAAHWPTTTPGDRVEVGLERDRAWAELVSRVRSGTLVAVDYGHTATARPDGGSLTAYVGGRQSHPVPDGSCDLTAHVAVDTLAADTVRTQRDALRALGLRGAVPPHATATADPLGYLAALEQASAEARLLDADGFGAFWWAVRRVGAPDGAARHD